MSVFQKTDVSEDEDDEVEEVKKIGPHPDTSTTLIFVNRLSNRKDFITFLKVMFYIWTQN